MSDPQEQEGSRRNIILGYEKVAEIDKRLAQLDVKLDGALDGFSEQAKRHTSQYVDHETRIRSLEQLVIGLVASGASRKDTWLWVWAAIMTLGQLGVSFLNYLK